MALCEVKFRSPTLQKAVGMHVILPQVDVPGPYPVWYLLHGLSDDYTIWHRHTRIEWYVRELPLIVVMPDGGRSFYCDAREGPAYETFFMVDLVGFVERFFPVISEGGGRVISGLSMGGYGAMKLALKHPERFCSAVSHSGALRIARDTPRDELRPELRRIFGDSARGGDDDLFALAESAEVNALPALRFDCGLDDPLLPHNRAFHDHLEHLGIPHEYEEFPGAHNWDFWDQHVQDAIAFHCRSLRLERPVGAQG
jgi:S-formylglutathione hydrolase FrmB